MIKVADVACGAGMASLGVCDALAAAGADPKVAAAVDPWGPAVDSYRTNLAGYLLPGAVRQTTAEAAGALPDVDVLLTGPPCIRDSGLTKAHGRTDRVEELAGTKAAAHVIGEESARIVVMETVGNGWIEWGEARGYQAVRLKDSDCGGYTMRRRTFLIRGVSAALSPPTIDSPRGWGEALPHWSGPGFVMANDADREVKRRATGGVAPNLPGYAVVGHGTAHRIYTANPWEYVHRLTPTEHAALSGFPNLALLSPRVRERQTLIGNGWPRSFGQWIAGVILSELG